ncbi:MAG: DNA polymerase III subunit alpha, partial [Oscillospiraceae bacterium]
PMTTLEELGLLKMDFLGLRNLTVIDYAEKMIKQHTPSFSMDAIDTADRETFEMLSMGYGQGVFQFESAGMRQVLVNLVPESVEDLIAVISLYRPGPMSSIPNKKTGTTPLNHLPPPLLEPILRVTGCIVIIAGDAEFRAWRTAARTGRRAMSRKKHDVMRRSARTSSTCRDGTWNEGCKPRRARERCKRHLQ